MVITVHTRPHLEKLSDKGMPLAFFFLIIHSSEYWLTDFKNMSVSVLFPGVSGDVVEVVR